MRRLYLRLLIINKEYFYNSYLIFLLITLFILNNNYFSSFKIIKQIAIFPLCIMQLRTKNATPVTKPIVTIIILSIIHFLIKTESYILTDAILISTSIVILTSKQISIKDNIYLRTTEFATFIYIIFSLTNFKIMGRGTIGGIDPNFSSLLIFLYLLYLIKMERPKLFIFLVSIAGILTMSRTYLLGLILLFAFFKIKSVKVAKALFVFLPFFFLSILHLVNSKLFKDIGLNFFEKLFEMFFYREGKDASLWRIFYLIGNSSDSLRADINLKTINLFFDNISFFFLGTSLEKLEAIHGFKAPHNFFLSQLTHSGTILGLIVFTSVNYCIYRKISSRTAKIILPLVSYYSFLGLESGSIYFLFFSFLISMNIENNEMKIEQ